MRNTRPRDSEASASHRRPARLVAVEAASGRCLDVPAAWVAVVPALSAPVDEVRHYPDLRKGDRKTGMVVAGRGMLHTVDRSVVGQGTVLTGLAQTAPGQHEARQWGGWRDRRRHQESMLRRNMPQNEGYGARSENHILTSTALVAPRRMCFGDAWRTGCLLVAAKKFGWVPAASLPNADVAAEAARAWPEAALRLRPCRTGHY